MRPFRAPTPKNRVETVNGRDVISMATESKHLSPMTSTGSEPPRLRRQDLEHPENFHRRLTAWIRKQR